MGKGDKKTKRGKIVTGSYGKTRPRKASKALFVFRNKEAEMPSDQDVKPKAAVGKATAVKSASTKSTISAKKTAKGKASTTEENKTTKGGRS
ncbi:MAG: 30S ribosomal protein THX [Bergeyella sp.]|nr:30S ribosomal protein THX [Bergeyella sp.]